MVPSAIQMKRFKFFTLELPLPSREYHFPSPAGVSADDLEFSEVEPKIFDEAVEMDLSEYCCSRHNRYGLGLTTVP